MVQKKASPRRKQNQPQPGVTFSLPPGPIQRGPNHAPICMHQQQQQPQQQQQLEQEQQQQQQLEQIQMQALQRMQQGAGGPRIGSLHGPTAQQQQQHCFIVILVVAIITHCAASVYHQQ